MCVSEVCFETLAFCVASRRATEHELLLHVAGPATPCPAGPEDLALALATATERSTNISGCRSLRQEVDSTTKVPRTGGQEP